MLWSQGQAPQRCRDSVTWESDIKSWSCSSTCPISKHPLTMMHRCCLGLAVASTSPVHPRALCPLLLLCSPYFSSTRYSFYFPYKLKLLCDWPLKQEISGHLVLKQKSGGSGVEANFPSSIANSTFITAQLLDFWLTAFFRVPIILIFLSLPLSAN